MTTLDSVTRLELNSAAPPTTLGLVGDVEPVLLSTCFWAPEPASDRAGAIRAIDVSNDSLCYGLGAAAFGLPPERAVQELGEYVLVDRHSWWTPAARSASSRLETAQAPVLTPFMIRWDNMGTATATLNSTEPIPIVQWYEHLMRSLTAAGACRTGTMTVEVVADVPARQVVDKRLMRAPLQEHRPADRKPITDESNLDAYFLRNAVTNAYRPDELCTMLMMGVVVDPVVAQATWGPDVIRRGFYPTPGVVATSSVIHHTHGLVTVRIPPNTAGASLSSPDGRFAWTARQLSTSASPVLATHLKNDTLIHEAIARVGVVEHIDMC